MGVEAEKVCQARIISDIPSAEDELGRGLGPHSRVAKAICELICEQASGGVISLEGLWGAGKSTVVRIVERQLPSSAHVFTFDAWAHSGDTLRRNFLASLASSLHKKEWLHNWDEKWGPKLTEFEGRRRETTSRSKTTTTPLANHLAVAALFVPVGVTVAAGAMRAGATLTPTRHFSLDLALGIAVALLPAIVLAGHWVASKLASRRFDLSLLSSKSNDSVVVENATPEPTSVEFEGAFRQLCADALFGDRRLVIVVDNLDRLPLNEFNDAWATLQTFSGVLRDIASSIKAWLVVPLDPRPASDGARDARIDLDKIFQVRFEVPPPIVSTWRSYLEALIKQALPKHEDSGLDVSLLYSEIWPGKVPTPRELKSIVNEVAVLHRQWGCEAYSISELACYVLLRRRETEGVAQWLLKNEIQPGIAHIVGSQAKPKLAGIAFGVPSEQGIQLLLEAPITPALTGNSFKLDQLAVDHGDGFWAVLHTVRTRLPDLQHPDWSTILINVADSPSLLADPRSLKFLQWIVAELERKPKLDRFDEVVGRSAGEIVARARPESGDRISEILEEQSIGVSDQSAKLSEVPFVQCLMAYRNALAEHGFSHSHVHKIGMTADRWLDVVKQIPGVTKDPRFAPAKDASELLLGIGLWAGSQAYAIPEEAVEALLPVDHRNWSVVVDGCLEAVLQTEGPFLNLNVERAVTILNRLVGVRPTSITTEQLTTALERFGEVVKQGSASQSIRVDSLVISTWLALDAEFLNRAESIGLEEHYRGALARVSGEPSDLLALIDQHHQENVAATFITRNLFQLPELNGLFEACLSTDGFAHHFPTDWIEQNWQEFEVSEGLQGKLLAIIHSPGSARISEIVSGEFHPDSLGFYSAVLGHSDSTQLRSWITRSLEEFPREKWADVLKSPAYLEMVVGVVSGNRESGFQSLALLDAIVEQHVDLLMTGQPAGRSIDPRTLLRPSLQTLFAQRMIVQLVTNGEAAEDYVRSSGALLLVPSALNSELVVNELFTRFVEGGDPELVNWTADAVSTADASSRLAEPAWDAFATRCKSRIQALNPDSALFRPLNSVLASLGIKLDSLAAKADEAPKSEPES